MLAVITLPPPPPPPGPPGNVRSIPALFLLSCMRAYSRSGHRALAVWHLACNSGRQLTRLKWVMCLLFPC